MRYDETPPAAPTNLQISESQDEHPVLNWTANTEPDLEEYNIYRKGGYPFIDWVVIETVNSTTYEDIELTTTYSHGEDYFYKITAVDVNNNESEDYSNTVEVEARLEKQNIVENLELKPKEYALNSNYPNPFNPTTNISYQLPKSSNVTLKVYDMLGKEVAELVNENKSAGVYNVSFNASNLPSGLYFYKIQADEFTEVRKMLLMK
ncbi:MAG: T9SS type A sorting domain-containing protein [Ignavibacteriae bacterium]|nr:T9SS type A sorting domain-containing protein [Ignavibacteriota bacterium]